MKLHALYLALLVTSLSGTALAAPVVFRVTGTFDSAEDSLAGFSGKSFVYDIVYDTLTEPTWGGGANDDYGIFSLRSFSAIVDGQRYDLLDPTAYLQSGSYGTVASFTASTGGQGQEGYLFNLDFEPTSPLDVTSLPTSLVTLTNGSSVSARMRDVSAGAEFSTNGSASASTVTVGMPVQATPEPTTTLALGLGAMGLLRRRRIRRA